jgi:hypothetical protein
MAENGRYFPTTYTSRTPYSEIVWKLRQSGTVLPYAAAGTDYHKDFTNAKNDDSRATTPSQIDFS